jgi:HSP20 family protein
MFDRFWGGYAASDSLPRRTASSWAIPVDVIESDSGVVITASVPGVSPEQLEVTVDDNVLVIAAETRSADSESEKAQGDDETGDSGDTVDNGMYVIRERRQGSFKRSIRLGRNLDATKIESRYENGTLTISIPLAEGVKARQIEIKTA